jgi:tetratricopeptide (TPR) repeat protein
VARPAAPAIVKRGALLTVLAGACGLTSQTQKGREADVQAENYELEASERRRVLADPNDIEPFLIAYAGTDAARRELISREVDLRDTEGCPAALAFLERVRQGIHDDRGRSLRGEAAVRRAELLLTDCRDAQAAIAAGQVAVRDAENTQWMDDAYWVLGRACEQAGRLDDALASYHWIVQTRSDAFPFGSNDSLFLDNAWLAEGLVLEKLGRYREARDTLEDLLDARDTRLKPKAEQALARMKDK